MAPNAEMNDHLGYVKHQYFNSRNSYSSKSLASEDGIFDIGVSRAP